MAGMTALGLSDLEESVYRHFLKHPGHGLEELNLLLGFSLEEVRSAHDRLVELELLHSNDSGVSPIAPSVAVERLVEERLRWLQQELHQVTQTRHLIAELENLQPATSTATVSHRTERLEDVGKVRERLEDLAFFAREEILSIESYAKYSQANIDHSRPLDMRCLRRKIRLRTIVNSGLLQDARSAAYLRELSAAGAGVRHQRELAERVLVYDRTTALVPADPTDASRGALVLHDPALVANLIALFDKTWHAARDLAVIQEEAVELSDVESLVLTTMCSVGKDETGARIVGVSVRTYRRYVADLLSTLGASSRPQAALLARERGWL